MSGHAERLLAFSLTCLHFVVPVTGVGHQLCGATLLLQSWNMYLRQNYGHNHRGPSLPYQKYEVFRQCASGV